MATELPRPGVEVIQEFRTATPTIVRPTLVPFVCGPAKEVIEVTTSDGTLNPDAKQGSYTQLPQVIPQTDFPSPRGNIDEVNVEEETIRSFFLFGGALTELERDPGDGFLTAWNYAGKATIRTKPLLKTGVVLDEMVLVLAVNVASRLNVTEDVVVTFASATGDPLTPTEIADQINAAVGADVATVVEYDGSNEMVDITSAAWGARSSITVRGGGTANSALFGSGKAALELRVEGAGFRAQDQANNTTLSPWVEWFAGAYYEDGVSATFEVGGASAMSSGLTTATGFAATSSGGTLSFSGAGSIDLRIGDVFYADGMPPNSSRIMKVEVLRFKLGTVNQQLSTYNEDGKLTSAVYDPTQVNTLYSSAPFSPRYAWFRAKNLSVTTVATQAELVGSTQGDLAEQAFVEGTSAPSTFLLTGLNLKVVVTKDGVEGDEQTVSFTGTFADMDDVVAAIDFDDVIATNESGKLRLSTTLSGAQQTILLKGTSSALTALGFASGDQSDTGKDIEFINVAAKIVGSAAPTLAGLDTKHFIVEVSLTGLTGGFSSRDHTFDDDPADMTALLAALNGDGAFKGTGTGEIVAVSEAGKLAIQSVGTKGENAVLRVKLTGNTAAVQLQFTLGQLDQGEDQLAGKKLRFKMNDRPKVYETTFISNSLPEAVAAVNALVEWPVASIGGNNEDQLVLTSSLAGFASKVQVLDDGAGSLSNKANNALGFGSLNRLAVGSGRPNPDFHVDVSGNAVLGGEILRNQATGAPHDPGTADIYLQYRGLRLDVSPSAVEPGMITVSDVTTLETVLGPLTSQNPLGLGMFFELVNAPNLLCAGLGVDEISAAAPEGTLVAYTKVANFIESQEVYAIAPLTHDETVAQMFDAHATTMSGPTQKGERVTLFCPEIPTRSIDAVVASGLSASSTATTNELILDSNPTSALLAAGIDPNDVIPATDNVFVELQVGGELRRYSVEVSNGVLTTFRTTFATGENDDDFFTTTPLTEAIVNADWSMKIRGTVLVIAGSTLPDKDKIAETIQKKAQVYGNRRFLYFVPNAAAAEVRSSVGGAEEILPAYYLCAAYAGLTASQPPQQSFTNMPIAGFTGIGSNVKAKGYFSEKQLDVMAAGGAFILIQEAQGAPLTCRHQLTTNLTSIETREFSITKVVDYVAKFLRVGLRQFIGRFNITQPLLDTISTVIEGMLSFLENNRIIISGDLNNIIQDTKQPDTVLVDVTLDVPYPCNYIRLTLVI